MEVRLDWLGVATFRLSIGDLVLFLDGYMDRVPAAPPVGLSSREVERADAVLVGHSHFDHLAGVENIALQTGATVIGSHETARVLREQGVPAKQLLAVSGGEPVRLSNDVVVHVFPSQHSCIWASGVPHSVDEECLGDEGVSFQERRARLSQRRSSPPTDDSAASVASRHAAELSRTDTDGGPLAYLIETPEGGVLWKDTSGHWQGILSDLRPDVALLAAAGRPNVNGEPLQGSLASFVAAEVTLTRPKRVALSHHDDWMPPRTSPTDVEPIRRRLATDTPGAQLIDLDYLDGRSLFAGL